MTAHFWTRERILEAFLAETDRLGRPPKKQDWLRATPEHPSPPTVINMFGSWNAGLKAAGLPVRKQGGPARWNRDLIVQGLYEAVYRLGRVPTADEMTVLSRRSLVFPSRYAVVYHFGSWTAGLKAAGYRPHRDRVTA